MRSEEKSEEPMLSCALQQRTCAVMSVTQLFRRFEIQLRVRRYTQTCAHCTLDAPTLHMSSAQINVPRRSLSECDDVLRITRETLRHLRRQERECRRSNIFACDAVAETLYDLQKPSTT